MNYLNPTDCARFQEKVIAQPSMTPALARKYLWQLWFFQLMLILGAISRTLPRNNLWIRNQALRSGLSFFLNRKWRAQRFYESMLSCIQRNCVTGPRHIEGKSYKDYFQYAVAWRAAITGQIDSILDMLLNQMGSVFDSLAGPDGRILTADTRFPEPKIPSDTFPAPFVARIHGFTIFRFPPDGFFIISHTPEIIEHRFNKHVNFDFGHFGFFINGKWEITQPNYTGYADKRSGEGKEAWCLNTIVGDSANPDKADGWRRYFSRTKLTIQEPWAPSMTAENPYGRLLLKMGPDSCRVFYFNNNYIGMEDFGGTYSAFNVRDPAHLPFEVLEGKATFDEGKKRLIITGARRYIQFPIPHT